MYYSYADETFTQLTQPKLLFDWGYATIDADINWLDSDQQWHMMIKKEGGQPGLFTATAKNLTGPWSEPVEDDYVSFEGKKKCEGVSAFQLAGHDDWVIGYIEYSSRPRNYRLCTADKFMRNFKLPRNIEGVNAPQLVWHLTRTIPSLTVSTLTRRFSIPSATRSTTSIPPPMVRKTGTTTTSAAIPALT